MLKAIEQATKEQEIFSMSAGGETTYAAREANADLSYLSLAGGATLEFIQFSGNLKGLSAIKQSTLQFHKELVQEQKVDATQPIIKSQNNLLFLSIPLITSAI
ncbi:MAG: hypothetical protein ABIG64_04810 [Candidatus Omnitrophota bacterium]